MNADIETKLKIPSIGNFPNKIYMNGTGLIKIDPIFLARDINYVFYISGGPNDVTFTLTINDTLISSSTPFIIPTSSNKYIIYIPGNNSIYSIYCQVTSPDNLQDFDYDVTISYKTDTYPPGQEVLPAIQPTLPIMQPTATILVNDEERIRVKVRESA